ncbi:homologous-pairing protein 2 homolog [Macrosteles quadrilineatus]|uniref:homologous-pairing protein 2 homolog n=1 Tax=Macrosteles quadrilineatus TaxID=74068 RepID=UPI0023E23F87|nr:homologous-pairing protein 2 homolog [Macrosteles quadrilineatus]
MAVEGVYKYLQSTNRPYSANDIVQNMHKEFGKTAVQKALDDLVTQQRIYEKAYGKQKIYCVKQPEDDGQDNDLAVLEAETEKVTQNYKNVEQEAKEAENSLRELLGAPTTAEAKEQLAKLEEKVETLRTKLAKLSENTVLVSPGERTKIKTEHEKLLKEYRKRKRTCMDIINAIMEGYPKSKKALMEEVGMETDEDVKMPTIQSY